ncbi:MAG: 50S ribosomal protein L24 [Oscillospiraceae bacterium]|nr:50S ribosomal protein L24 [Oscillospiraceae bacterium]
MTTAKKLHVRHDDVVVVISGTDKGKKGKVLSAYPKTGRVVVEGVRMVTKHQKPRNAGAPGGIIHKEAPIDASKVLLLCSSCSRPVRQGYKILEDGTKVRVCKRCGASFDN